MKKITLLFLVFLLFAFASPASAERVPPTVGVKISILPTDYDPYPPVGLTFTAGNPFFIQHGWCWDVGNEKGIGHKDFRLSIDGVPVAGGERYIQPTVIQPTGCGEMGVVTRIFNFPDGLSAGKHTFEGFWYISCQYGPNPSECTDPNAPVLGLYSNIIIDFTAP